MDYDRYDALLHHIFKQTQGDAWFRPNEDNLSAGVALRVTEASATDGLPEYRVFPYENLSLEPFEAAVVRLNPAVAVKVRSAAVHAALADVYVRSLCYLSVLLDFFSWLVGSFSLPTPFRSHAIPPLLITPTVGLAALSRCHIYTIQRRSSSLVLSPLDGWIRATKRLSFRIDAVTHTYG